MGWLFLCLITGDSVAYLQGTLEIGNEKVGIFNCNRESLSQRKLRLSFH